MTFICESESAPALHNQILPTNFSQILNPPRASKSPWKANGNTCDIIQTGYLSTSGMQWNLRREGCWRLLFIEVWSLAITHKVSASICMNFLSLSTVSKIIFYFEMNRIWLLPCPLLPRMHLACSCLNSLQKPYDPMIFLHTTGDATKARHHLMIQAITHKMSVSICMNFLSLSTVSKTIFYFEINKIWLLPCPSLPRMHLAHSCLNRLQKPYDPMVFLHNTGNATKARHHLVRMTETCNQLMSPHVKCKSDLLPTGYIWPYEPSYKVIANSHHLSHLILDFRYSYSLTGFSTI